jgi:hypothetical protein
MELPTKTKDAMGLNHIVTEIQNARVLHKPLNSSHEAYSVILEELDEFWDEVKKKSRERDRQQMARELVQVAAMALRALSDLNLVEELPQIP